MASTIESGSTASLKKPLYEASSQYRNWRFSPERLTEIRRSLNEAAVAVIRNNFETDEVGSSSSVSFLSADEERLLVKLYTTKISQLCSLFHFPEEVEATAVTYLKRFYLKNTVMDWHPKNVMLTALFLAAKTTNNPISLETYTSRIPRTESSDVLDLEFLVAQSLGFEFAVWPAHRALWGIWLDIQALPDLPVNSPSNIYDQALNHVRASRMTDAELIYPPSQIALAAISLAAPDLAKVWLQSKLSLKETGTLSAEVEAVVEAIKILIIHHGQPPEVESVREVDKRLKLCKNPEKVRGSKVYILKKAEEEKKAEEKRQKKAVEGNEGDPFGNAIPESTSALVDYDDDDD